MTTDERIETRIVELIEERDELHRRAEALDATIDELRKLLPDDGRGREEEEPAPRASANGKPARKPAAARPPGGDGDGGEEPSGNADPRLRGLIGTLLCESGPMNNARIAQRLEVTGPAVARHLKGNPDLFRKTDPDSRLSTWELTEAGLAKYGSPVARG